MDEWEIEIARRLCAAVLSYQLGTSFDRQMKEMSHNNPGEFWLEMARSVRTQISAAGDRIVGPGDRAHES